MGLNRPEPLVLLPAMLGDEALWAHQTSVLSSARDVHVMPMVGPDSITGLAEMVLDQSPDRFGLAGLSLGGIVAMEVIRRAPERVTRLALLGTNAGPPTESQHDTWRFLAQQTHERGVRETVRDGLLDLLISDTRHIELDAAVLDMAERIGPEGFLSQLAAQHSRGDMRSSLPLVNCPTLVASGRSDPMCPPQMHEDIAALIPHARLVTIEDCGHLAPLERPQAVSALLDLWTQL